MTLVNLFTSTPATPRADYPDHDLRSPYDALVREAGGRGTAGRLGAEPSAGPRASLLGRPRVGTDPETSEAIELRADRRHQLLAYLAYQGTWVERSRLAELFWGDSPQDTASQNLRQLVGRAKRLPWAADLEVDRQRVRWRVRTDVAELREALSSGHLGAAAELDRGPLLEGVEGYEASEFSTWLELEREQLWSLSRTSLLGLASESAADGDPEAAAALLERVIERDPFDEEAVALRLELGRDHPRVQGALRVYREFARRLGRELGMEPAAATRRLAEELAAVESRPTPRGTSRPPADAASTAAVGHAGVAKPGTSFIGRTRELGLIGKRLGRDDGRLVTLVGPSGIGKTRLAREALRIFGGSFERVTFVQLLHAKEADDLPRRLAQALGISLGGAGNGLTEVVAALHEADVLVVLDNLEHLSGAAAVVAELLAAAPRLRLLATSHERLGLAQEWVLSVEGLPLSSGGPEGAVDLFVSRARLTSPDFEPSAADLGAIERLCRLLNGTPLAIELAAAWTRVLPVSGITEQLEESLDFLADGAPDREERHRSLRSVFDYTWSLLDAGQRRSLARLAVFRGGFTHAAAASVTDTNLAQLAALVDRSLIRASGGRFDVHSLLRAYLLEELAGMDEEPAASRDRHLRYYVALVECPSGAGASQVSAAWRERMAADSDNLMAALEWAASRRSQANVELGFRLAAQLHGLWVASSNLREGRARIDALLSAAGELRPSGALARSLIIAGALSMFLAEFDLATSYLMRALDVASQAGDDAALARAHGTLGATAVRRGLHDDACEHLRLGMELMRSDPDPDTLVRLLTNLAALNLDDGEADLSAAQLEEALAVVRPLGDDLLQMTLEHNLGLAELLRGANAKAAHYLGEALARARAAGAQRVVADVLNALTSLALAEDDLAAAEAASSESLAIRSRLGDDFGLAYSFEARAALSARTGDPRRAATLLGAAAALRQDLGAPLPLSWSKPVDAAREACERALGPSGYEAEAAIGGRLGRQAAVALAAGST